MWTALGHRSWGKVLGKPHLATCGLGWLLTPCRGSTSETDENKIKQEITKLGGGSRRPFDMEQIPQTESLMTGAGSVAHRLSFP